jgi:peptidoglycan/xylan/chitin deacetylase (PgdA/CDA1 family)
VRGLDAQGFQIGCHSMTHPYLSDLTEPELKREVADAKLQHAYDRLRAVLLGNPASKP